MNKSVEKKEKIKRPIVFRLWFKILFLMLSFLPLISQKPYDPTQTAIVISEVLGSPLIEMLPWVRIAGKFALLAVSLLLLFYRPSRTRIPLIYYTIMLVLVGFFQNMAFTENYGFVWLIGNTLLMVFTALFCLNDLVKKQSFFKPENLNRNRLWVVPLMGLAILMPFGIRDGSMIPALNWSIFSNGAGVAYCFITPVIEGLLLLYSKGIKKTTLSIISFTGSIFAIFNLMTWFVFIPESWWMGVLHLPLFILSVFGIRTASKEYKAEIAAAQSAAA
mgnify:CR=1 FL=1|jgi:hypothetical protein